MNERHMFETQSSYIYMIIVDGWCIKDFISPEDPGTRHMTLDTSNGSETISGPCLPFSLRDFSVMLSVHLHQWLQISTKRFCNNYAYSTIKNITKTVLLLERNGLEEKRVVNSIPVNVQ